MRTNDRTLLQHLGFNDPDKRNEEHDLACRFLIQPETMDRLIGVVGKVDNPSPFEDYRHGEVNISHVEARALGPAHVGHVEVLIKRDRFHLGFADVVIEGRWRWEASRIMSRHRTFPEAQAMAGSKPDLEDAAQRRAWDDRVRELRGEVVVESRCRVEEVAGLCYKAGPPVRLGVEVKIGRAPVGDCIRQIKLYDDHLPSRWVLATRYTITTAERESLSNEGIRHIRLAEGFDRFLEEQRSAPASESPEF